MFLILIAILVAYLIGSIPTSFIFAKLLKGIDIRNYGSGNIGATNLMRVAGPLPAIAALILDMTKGVIVVTLVAFIFFGPETRLNFDLFRMLLGLAVIFGHIWTVFLKFKGGKGIATSSGVLLILAPEVFGVAVLVWILTVAISRYVSLGSILASISLPISAAINGKPIGLVIFCITLCIISSYKHKANIRRLLRNEEPKIGHKTNVK